MLDLAVVPAAVLPQPPGNVPAAPEADGNSGGFADLLGTRLEQSAPATPAADAQASERSDAANESDTQERDKDAAGHAVAGIWLAQDWVQRLGEPAAAGPTGEPRDSLARRTARVHGNRAQGEAPTRPTAGAEPDRAGVGATPEPAEAISPAEAASTRPADHDPFSPTTESAGTEDAQASPAQLLKTGDAAAATLAGTVGGGAASARAVGSTPAVHIATPAGDAHFPAALAAQVSMLVSDGVQEAKLHLHPAEMGPVAVQIAMEGTRARIHFVAAVDSTCQLLEDSLGQLDSALSAAGLSLTGSGVFHQSADPGQQQAAGQVDARGGAGPSGNDAAALLGARPLRPRGMIDLVA